MPAGELFDAVAIEVRQLLGADVTRLLRFEDDGTATLVAGRGEPDVEIDDGNGFRREEGTVRAPVVVAGRQWGVMVAAWKHDRQLSADLEERIAQFTELVATAIANAESRAELAASRARVVATADETRRRIQRDLHDGAQQRLVHTVITLKLAKRAVGDATGQVAELIDDALRPPRPRRGDERRVPRTEPSRRRHDPLRHAPARGRRGRTGQAR